MITTQKTKLWLPFEGDCNDNSGNGLNGTANNITYAAGEVGRCAVFDGSTSYVSCPNIPMKENMSFVFDVYLNTISGTHFIFSKRTSSGNGISIFTNDNNLVFDFGGSSNRLYFSSYSLVVGRLQFTIVRTSTYTKLFVNGLVIVTSTIVGTTSLDVSTNFNIGRDPATSGYFFNGKINFIQVYNAELTAQNVARIYNGLHPIF